MTKESQNIEWKESWRDEYLKWICGFANAHGGKLIIGKNDKGKIVTLKDVKRLLEEIPNKIRDTLGIIIDINLKKSGKIEYLELIIPPYPNPISYKGQYHYRSGSTKQVLKGQSLDRFLLHKQGKRWDSVPIPKISVSMLDTSAIDFFRKKAAASGRVNAAVLNENNNILLENLHLIEENYLKRAAVLLFHKDPEKFFQGAYIKIGYFQTEAELIYQNEIHGSLFAQAEETFDLLATKYLKAYISYKGITRIEQFLFPIDALREALLNAIVHKDYSSGIPIQIKVFDDRILFWNEGQLPQNWTIAELKKQHPSKPFNPDIANAFFRAGYIESWGRGIEKMVFECKGHGIPAPRFKYIPNTFMLEFNAHSLFQKFTSKYDTIENLNSEEGGQKRWSEKVVGKGGQKLTDKQRELVEVLKKTPTLTRKNISELFGINESAVQKRLDILKRKGVLERKGGAKSGYWNINE